MKMAPVLLSLFTSFLYSSDYPSLPAKDPLLNAYPTLNGYGSCFEPTDPMSTQFAKEINEHRRNQRVPKAGEENYKHRTPQNITKVLEIGVGYGLLARSILEKRFDNNLCCYTGIDLEPKHLGIATQQINGILPADNTAYWDPVVGDFPNTSFTRSNHFTHIGAFCVLHFATPEKLQKTLCTIERLLAHGGRAYISTLRADTIIYGPFVQDYYRTQKEAGAELPGYIDDFPKFIDKLLASDGLPEKARQLILAQQVNAGEKQAQKALLLTIDDLAAQVRKHTTLSIKLGGVVERLINNTQVPYIGMILEKE